MYIIPILVLCPINCVFYSNKIKPCICVVFDAHCLPLLQDVIGLFAGTPDPDYPGHVLLEQYQAQVWSEPGAHILLYIRT